MCAHFQTKRITLTFLAQICPKMDFWLEIQKTNVEIRISILETPCAPIFSQNGQLWLFGPKLPQKWILGLEFQKSKSVFGISTSKIPCEPIFSQNGQLWIFRPKFLLRVLLELGGGWNALGGGGWSWVEVGAQFSDTHN